MSANHVSLTVVMETDLQCSSAMQACSFMGVGGMGMLSWVEDTRDLAVRLQDQSSVCQTSFIITHCCSWREPAFPVPEGTVCSCCDLAVTEQGGQQGGGGPPNRHRKEKSEWTCKYSPPLTLRSRFAHNCSRRISFGTVSHELLRFNI